METHCIATSNSLSKVHLDFNFMQCLLLSELSTIDSKGTQVKCDAEDSKLLFYMILFYCSPDLCCIKKVAPSSA